MLHKFMMLVVVLVPTTVVIGCGAESGTKVLNGEVAVDPNVDASVNDPEAMEAMMDADPSQPK
ncbi:hypothetical protein [Allorhodopirellula solitaria]|uniref:Uncharacterized protein n=1 Tax=Allorhodopirellula solitaria TaxID=2527987 RepID=A0A5C5X1C9_9BACT|nr:hypothetical protein [Allorhodopirellula solitaria]TWT56022.1 hypothetical protein CA85_46130 [Allorhodopirellula solitaria]